MMDLTGKALSSLPATALVAFAGCLFYVLLVVLRAAFSPLRHIPGPFLTKYTRLWYFVKVWQGDFEQTNIKLHKTYGI